MCYVLELSFCQMDKNRQFRTQIGGNYKGCVSSQKKMITNKNTEIQEDSEQILANI